MSDASGRILAAESGGIARLALDSPATIGALPADPMADLARRLRRLGARQDLDLLVLEGAGPRGSSAGIVAAEHRAPALPGMAARLGGKAVRRSPTGGRAMRDGPTGRRGDVQECGSPPSPQRLPLPA